MGAAQAQRPDEELGVLRQFDFWLGEWDLSWFDDGRATNSIYLDFDGRVIVESFDGRPSLTLQRMSVSTYDLAEGCWRQTWVDNNGGYYSFRGGFEDGEMDLRTERVVEGRSTLLRVRWHSIEESSLEWAWERSEDGGKCWEAMWEISYARVV